MISTVPEDTAVTKPAVLTVAIDGLLEDQTPFDKLELKVDVLPTHNGPDPVMILSHVIGDVGFTRIVTVFVALQVPVKLYVTIAVPSDKPVT